MEGRAHGKGTCRDPLMGHFSPTKRDLLAASVKVGLIFLEGCRLSRKVQGVLARLESCVNWSMGTRRWGLGDALSLTSLHLLHWFCGFGSTKLCPSFSL